MKIFAVLVLFFALTNAFYLDSENKKRPTRSPTIDSTPNYVHKMERDQENKKNLNDNYHGGIDNAAVFSKKPQIGDDSNSNRNDAGTPSTTELTISSQCQTSLTIKDIGEYCEILQKSRSSNRSLSLRFRLSEFDCLIRKLGLMHIIEHCDVIHPDDKS